MRRVLLHSILLKDEVFAVVPSGQASAFSLVLLVVPLIRQDQLLLTAPSPSALSSLVAGDGPGSHRYKPSQAGRRLRRSPSRSTG